MIATGFYGKLPTRGDFVQAGLPRAFVDRWDGWCRTMLTWSREALGERWQPAWLEAPIWRFCLTAGLAGSGAATGVWVPSVDRVGRYFPFTVAAISTSEFPADDPFLDDAEQIALDALERDLTPDEIAQRLPTALPQATARSRSRWWTSGSPLVAARSMELDDWPDAACCARMLADGAEAG